jgi:diguanylate cyclase (GGDEF)-like protein
MRIDVPGSVLEKWQNIVDTMAQIIAVPAGLIMRIVDNDIQVFVSSNTAGNPYHAGDGETLFNSGLYCETVIRKDRKLLVPNALEDDAWKNNPDVKLNMTSYLGFPIRWPDRTPFGTICVLDNKPNTYSDLHENLLMQFRDVIEQYLQLIYMNVQLGIAKAEVEVLNEQLKIQASTDSLTGVLNRRRFDEIFAQEWRRAVRDKATLSLLLIDVDHFKHLNDDFGHLRGDDALKMVALVLQTMAARAGDVVARYGGEEFAVLLPHTSADHAHQLAEAIRRAVARTVLFKAEGCDITGTVCIGVASQAPSSAGDPLRMMQAADAALYRAKLSGRNRVVEA